MGKRVQTSLARIDPEDYIPTSLMVLNNRLASGASDLYIRLFGLGINEWRSLNVIYLFPGCHATTIVERIGIHKTVVSRSLQALISRQYVQPAFEGGRRVLYLTDTGEDVYHQIAAIALERVRLLLSGLSAAETATLKSLLHRLIGNLEIVDQYKPERAKRSR